MFAGPLFPDRTIRFNVLRALATDRPIDAAMDGSGSTQPCRSDRFQGFLPWLLLVLMAMVSGMFPGRAQAGEAAFDLGHAAWTAVLQRHVEQGWVDYPALVRERAPLDAYLDRLAAVTRAEFDQWSREDRIAFLINLYNATTIQLVRDHYPVTSIRKIGGLFTTPWKLQVVRVWGSKITLNDLEHVHLRRDLTEPRIHFALVCAARSCPALRSSAWTGLTLESDLDTEARRFLRDPSRNRLDRKEGILYLSSIFDWYGKDFTSGDKTLSEVVGIWMEDVDREYLSGNAVKVRFNYYDWSLNGPRPAAGVDAPKAGQ
jgi:hypothetical protein